ncbi:MAG TPA: hypothetical protein VHE30_16475 [Polyangiaceae bacterium]|nr:hypothetical protein [Polyangiaceae bacterium]
MPDALPAWAAEFPNDNPALHEGVSWVCLSVLGPAKPVRRPGSASRPLASVASLVPAMTARAHAVAPETLVERRADVEADVPSVATPPEIAPESTVEPLPESVLAVLLEKLDLDLTPPAPVDDVLDIDASDLEHTPLPETATYADVVAELREAQGRAPESDAAEPVVPEAAVAEPVIAEACVPEASDTAVLSAVSPTEPAAPEAPATPDDDYAAFVGALVEVLLAHGATRAGAVLPSLLESGGVDAGLLDDATVQSLALAKIAESHGGAVRLRDEFQLTARAWRDVLRGTTQDLGACGTSTLDGWASDLLRAFGVGREGRVDVRRELRRRGVAAFGMLRAA